MSEDLFPGKVVREGSEEELYGADSLGRSAGKAVRALVGHWKSQAHNSHVAATLGVNTRGQRKKAMAQMEVFLRCAFELEAAMRPALAAERERACLPNENGQR